MKEDGDVEIFFISILLAIITFVMGYSCGEPSKADIRKARYVDLQIGSGCLRWQADDKDGNDQILVKIDGCEAEEE